MDNTCTDTKSDPGTEFDLDIRIVGSSTNIELAASDDNCPSTCNGACASKAN